MKRYLLFGGDYYYPRGGWSDFIESADTLEEIRASLDDWLDREHKWFHVIDTTTWNRVSDYEIWPYEGEQG